LEVVDLNKDYILCHLSFFERKEFLSVQGEISVRASCKVGFTEVFSTNFRAVLPIPNFMGISSGRRHSLHNEAVSKYFPIMDEILSQLWIFILQRL
jgi:hypothetical protein